jgi:hypothetical protein
VQAETYGFTIVRMAKPIIECSLMNETKTETLLGFPVGCTNGCVGCSQYSSSTSSGRSTSMLRKVGEPAENGRGGHALFALDSSRTAQPQRDVAVKSYEHPDMAIPSACRETCKGIRTRTLASTALLEHSACWNTPPCDERRYLRPFLFQSLRSTSVLGSMTMTGRKMRANVRSARIHGERQEMKCEHNKSGDHRGSGVQGETCG